MVTEEPMVVPASAYFRMKFFGHDNDVRSFVEVFQASFNEFWRENQKIVMVTESGRNTIDGIRLCFKISSSISEECHS